MASHAAVKLSLPALAATAQSVAAVSAPASVLRRIFCFIIDHLRQAYARAACNMPSCIRAKYVIYYISK